MILQGMWEVVENRKLHVYTISYVPIEEKGEEEDDDDG